MVDDVLVIGGGLAGGAAAVELAGSGVRVRLLERERAAHHKVCGEFVSVEVQRDLARLGIDLPRLGAVRVDRVRLVAGCRKIEAPLPFTALSLSRAVLDEAILAAAKRAGAVIERGVRVTGLTADGATTSDGPRPADDIFLATGKHDLRGLPRDKALNSHGYLGFKMHWQLPPGATDELGSAVELVLFDGGYVGFQRVAESTLNMSLLVRSARFHQIGARWDRLVEDLRKINHIAHLLDGAVPLFPRPMTVAALPYGYTCDPAAPLPPNVYRLGDQAGVTAPLTGDGMAIATRSARIAVACRNAGVGAAAYHAQVRRAIAPQIGRAMALQRLAGMPAARPLAIGVLRLWPEILGRLAGATRIAEGTWDR